MRLHHCGIFLLLCASHIEVLSFTVLPHFFVARGNDVATPYYSTRSAFINTQLGLARGGGTTDMALRLARQVQPSVALVLPKGVRNMTARGSGFVVNFNN